MCLQVSKANAPWIWSKSTPPRLRWTTLWRPGQRLQWAQQKDRDGWISIESRAARWSNHWRNTGRIFKSMGWQNSRFLICPIGRSKISISKPSTSTSATRRLSCKRWARSWSILRSSNNTRKESFWRLLSGSISKLWISILIWRGSWGSRIRRKWLI